jgi:hypothetical protein
MNNFNLGGAENGKIIKFKELTQTSLRSDSLSSASNYIKIPTPINICKNRDQMMLHQNKFNVILRQIQNSKGVSIPDSIPSSLHPDKDPQPPSG